MAGINIISCDKCGVLLDSNKLKFAEVRDEMQKDPDDRKGLMWDDEIEEYVPFVLCPVCGANILERP